MRPPSPALLALALLGCSDYGYQKVKPLVGDQPAIEVSPTHLDFGGLQRGEVGTQTFTIASVGDVALDIGEIRLRGPDAFTVIEAPAFSTLAPGTSAEVTVTYSPSNTGDSGEIIIANSDPSLPEALVTLNGIGLIPLLQFDPPQLDFGYVPVGDTADGTIDLVNGGGAPLVIDSALVLGEGFTSSLPTLPATLAPNERLTVEVGFAPVVEARYQAELWVESNTPAGASRAAIQGTSIDQPVAVCDATPREAYALIDSVTWLGSGSYDPSGEAIAAYEWSLIERPAGSRAALPSGDADLYGFVPDMVGDYVAELIVQNASGVSSEPCYATVTAVPSQDLWVELYWVTDQDDMDLHLVNGSGALTSGDDCYYANCVGRGLDWGELGNADDDPSLDIDDIPGTGPENINIREPAEGSSFTVYVHDYTGSTPDFYGDNEVTVNVYLSGVLEFTDTRMIDGDGDYVPFARVNWDAQTVSPL
jgi:hypothetical protein